METIKRPGLLLGGLIGLLITAPVMAAFYMGDQLAGLPFVPFDVFAFIRDNLPGDIITTGIDAMVDTIINLELGEVDTTAKALEQFSGLMMMLGIGIVAAAVIYEIIRLSGARNAMILSLAAGLVIGIVMALISDTKDITSTTDPALNGIWIVVLFIAWGGALGWAYNELIKRGQPQAQTQADGVHQIDRRQFLVRLGGATATLTVIGTGLSLIDFGGDAESEPVASGLPNAESNPESTAEPIAEALPNADANLEPAPGTRPEYTPLDEHYRIDISARPPNITESEWVLEVSGLIAQPVMMTLDNLRDDYEPVDQFITLSCISNRVGGSLISTTRWTGVPLHILLDEWDVSPDARYLKITGADGFDEYVELSLIRRDERVMLCYAWDGQPLKQKHGFPLRIYIPDHYGMKQPKWITKIEVVDAWGEGYWVRRGWSETAIVRTTSVIDTVAVEGAFLESEMTYIPIGGIAYAGAKGISKVEVQVDEGEWTEAQLRDPISELTWVIWRYDWPFTEGDHSFRVRTYTASGERQIERSEGVRPDGATGIHRVGEDIDADSLPAVVST